jgi:hypothetical protein
LSGRPEELENWNLRTVTLIAKRTVGRSIGVRGNRCI